MKNSSQLLGVGERGINMRKLLLVSETVTHTHAIEIEANDDDEFDQLLDDLDCDPFEDTDNVLNALKEMDNIKILGVENDYSIDVENIEFEITEAD
jgi:hypothetical protein